MPAISAAVASGVAAGVTVVELAGVLVAALFVSAKAAAADDRGALTNTPSE
jgi:hypothetical protein